MTPSAEAADFDRHFVTQYPQIVSELDYMLGDTDLAREVAQEAFVRQFADWKRLSGYQKPGAWVRRVALRIAFRVRTKLFRHIDWDSVPEPAVEDRDSDKAIDVRRAILRLTNAQRAAVVLRYYRQMSDAEVAQVMNVKEPTVRSHLFHARERLAELLKAYGPGQTGS